MKLLLTSILLLAVRAAAAEPLDVKALQAQAKAIFPALPSNFDSKDNPFSEDKLALGRMLYFDKRLSKNQDVSCNSCHGLTTYGVDSEQTSLGHKKQRGARNSPTVYNAAGHFAQFWDGRAKDVEAQAEGPMLNSVEMANADGKAVEAVLKSIPAYVAAFQKAYGPSPDPLTFSNAARAIAVFERRLTTPGRWDKFVGGDEKALTEPELKGLKAFLDSGCTACHMGPLFGGALFQKLGLLKPWPNLKDNGRFDVTKQEADRGFFKAPSLRNVAKTAPYFHDGSVPTLDAAVKMMAEHQLGKQLKPDEVKSLVTFLEALTGDLPTALIKEPKLPASTKATPKPDPS